MLFRSKAELKPETSDVAARPVVTEPVSAGATGQSAAGESISEPLSSTPPAGEGTVDAGTTGVGTAVEPAAGTVEGEGNKRPALEEEEAPPTTYKEVEEQRQLQELANAVNTLESIKTPKRESSDTDTLFATKKREAQKQYENSLDIIVDNAEGIFGKPEFSSVKQQAERVLDAIPGEDRAASRERLKKQTENIGGKAALRNIDAELRRGEIDLDFLTHKYNEAKDAGDETAAKDFLAHIDSRNARQKELRKERKKYEEKKIGRAHV